MYVIVWDLDGTLGDFSPLQLRGERPDAPMLRTRPGLAECLRALSDAGFVHTLLTLATPRYAELALTHTGLRQFFTRVEGLGVRGKGDAEGIGEVMGVPADDRPHCMIFVGDHPHYDAPCDPRVVFHLEFCALSRPAGELQKLILYLRDSGRGSLRDGFDRLLRRAPWWEHLWPWRRRSDDPVARLVPGLGSMVLLARPDSCPVIGFRDPPTAGAPPSEHPFDLVPSEEK